MKKLVAISVLLAVLAAAVFAQDDEGKWKVGFKAQFVTDMFAATSMKAKTETTAGGTTTSSEFGEYNKGTVNFFGNRDNPWHSGPGQRLLLSIANSGEGYDVYLDMKLDDWVSNYNTGTGGNEGWGGTFIELLNAGNADWYVKGTAGIFNASLGTSGYGGFVSTQATWNDWLGWNNLCRFGVWKGIDTDNDFFVGDDFRTWSQWGTIAALGIALGDNYKFSLGYRINPGIGPWYWNPRNTDFDPTASRSSINGSFMLNGRVTDAIAFDLFYSIIGQDNNTFERPVSTGTLPATAASWQNIVGVYVGLNVVENLGISIGYTANFDVYETTAFQPSGVTQGETWNYKERNFTAPIYSGIDIHLSYSGIDKIGLNFNNNISLAGAKATKLDGDWSEAVLGLDKGVYQLAPNQDSSSTDWFHWNGELKASLGFIEGVGLTLHLGDQLGTTTVNESYTGGGTYKSTRTFNEFRVSLFADHGVGAVTVGAGIDFGVKSRSFESEASSGGSTITEKRSSNVTYFGIPILFRVAF